MSISPRPTFYRRTLPNVCIAFSSEKGKQLFADALTSGHMNCYFTLASQFRTQDEPSYCGLSSLVMVLNALAVDPGHVWKGVFRWYHEDMLDCCTSLDEVRKNGISFANLMCLAFCNQLHGEMTRVTYQASITDFREEVKLSTTREDRAIILSYGRQVLGQTGTGHYSPIGGYNVAEDMVLILDVARFKYPPYWVPLSKLWEAMNTIETDTGLPRGYMTLWRSDSKTMPSQPPLLFKVAQRFNASHSIVDESGNLLVEIESFLSQQIQGDEDDAFKAILKMLLRSSYKQFQQSGESSFLTLRVTSEQISAEFPGQIEAIEGIIKAIEETEICQKIDAVYPNGICCKQGLFSTANNIPIDSKSTCCLGPSDSCKICLKHFLTVFILSFPMVKGQICPKKVSAQHGGTYNEFLCKVVQKELKCDTCDKPSAPVTVDSAERALLMNEVKQLRKQFNVLMEACK